MYLVTYTKKGSKYNVEEIIDKSTGEVITPRFANYTCVEDYENSHIIPIEPMTAKEPLNEESMEEMINDPNTLGEEKLDGVRETLHLLEGGNRLFSRRISKKTNWYAENTDSLPHIRDMDVPKELYGTILDGELRINGRDFKDVSSTMNCNWDEAILRQQEFLGFVSFHAFDIIYFRGVYVAKLPLSRRKDLLKYTLDLVNNEYVENVPFATKSVEVEITKDMINRYKKGHLKKEVYPNLYDTMKRENKLVPYKVNVNKQTWYEYIVFNGGEGLMLKYPNGRYYHKRGREYTKIKKFDTWDVIILDFVPPTMEYTGKEIDTWNYWYHTESGTIRTNCHGNPSVGNEEYIPVTKYFAMNWIGTIKFGVILTEEEYEQWKKENPSKTPEILETKTLTGTMQMFLVVGETSGFSEEQRQYFTEHQEEYRGKVIEVKAQEVLKTGKLRHPRFLRMREDKDATQCIWKDHMRKEED